MQITTPLLLPLLGLGSRFVHRVKAKAYLGYYPLDGEAWGEYMYLTTKELLEDDLDKLTKHPWFKELIDSPNGSVFQFEIPELYKRTIIQPFLKGQYSKIDRKYVENNFFPTFLRKDPVTGTETTIQSLNWMILTKSEDLRAKWEEDLDVSIDPDAELWDKPFPDREILLYEQKLLTDVYEELGITSPEAE